MNRQPHILILEDNASDAELERRELRKSGLEASVRVAADRNAYLQALDEFVPDLILADYSLPGFDGLTALLAARQRFPDIPVVIVSGVIGEETAIDAMKSGATDYVLKNRLFRLGPVARRALLEAEQRAGIRRAEDALRESEALLREVTENSPDAIYVKDLQSRWLMANPAVLRIVGKSAGEAIGRTDLELYADPEIGRAILENDRRVMEGGIPREFEEVVDTSDGRRTFLSIKAPRRDAQGTIVGVVGVSRDITDRKQAQDQLKSAYAQLDQKVRERTEELRRANTTLRMLWECNETLMRVTDEEEFMRQVCRIIVEEGGYRMAWVGYAEDDEEKTVRPVAVAGTDDGYLDEVLISWGDAVQGQGPTGTCIRTGAIEYSHDIATNPRSKPWRSAGLKPRVPVEHRPSAGVGGQGLRRADDLRGGPRCVRPGANGAPERTGRRSCVRHRGPPNPARARSGAEDGRAAGGATAGARRRAGADRAEGAASPGRASSTTTSSRCSSAPSSA